MGTLKLSDKLFLSILQKAELEDLKSPDKRNEFRKILRQRTWEKLWEQKAS